MTRVNRTDVIQKAVNDLAFSQSGEKIPNETLDKIQLVYSLNNEFANVVIGANQSTTGSFTIYTTSASKDFYLSSITASFAKDSTCDIATGAINITANVGGISRALAGFSVITLTAQANNLQITFAKPIKIDKSAAIAIGGAFTLGVMARFLSISGIERSSN